MLVIGRHGGLQNMEVRGLMLLRVNDPALSKLVLNVDNNDTRGFQMQVSMILNGFSTSQFTLQVRSDLDKPNPLNISR